MDTSTEPRPVTQQFTLNARQLVHALRSRGFVLQLSWDDPPRLWIAPVEHLTPSFIERISKRKQEVVDVLLGEREPIHIGHCVGSTQVAFPGASLLGETDIFEPYWNLWRKKCRSWWPDITPLERLELSCTVLKDIIEHLSSDNSPGARQADARARYCWGRTEALFDAISTQDSARG